MHNVLVERLNSVITLTDRERTVVERIDLRERQLQRGRSLVRENENNSQIFLVVSGMLMTSVVLNDGRRQILDFLFPGDITGWCTLAYGTTAETVTAMAASTLVSFERGAVAGLLVDQPRLGGLFLSLTQVERVALTDRLAGLGRTSAKARVAALLLTLRDRLHRNDPDIGETFTIPVTQEEIGDAIGLTAVHVNRMLRQLEYDGLIDREGARVTLRDRRELARAANYVDRSKLDLGWLPPAR